MGKLKVLGLEIAVVAVRHRKGKCIYSHKTTSSKIKIPHWKGGNLDFLASLVVISAKQNNAWSQIWRKCINIAIHVCEYKSNICNKKRILKVDITWAKLTISPRTAYSHFKTCKDKNIRISNLTWLSQREENWSVSKFEQTETRSSKYVVTCG